MTITATGTSLGAIQARIEDYSYELLFTRQDDGNATADFYQYDSMGVATLLDSASVAAWDDATPWAEGRFEASVRTGGLFGKPAWIISPNPASRDAIRLHVGATSDNSHGCLVTDGAFLQKISDRVGTANFRVHVVNDYPLELSLSASETSVVEGHTIELTATLNQPVSKDMWVRVELDSLLPNAVSTVSPSDLTILKDDLKYLSAPNASTPGQTFSGWYAHIEEGETQATIKVKVNADSNVEGIEKARFVIADYAISDDTKQGPDSRFYADPKRLNINPAADSVTLDIRDQELPLVESGSSGRYPFTIIGASGQVFEYQFEAYGIPDRLVVTYGSAILVDTGVVSNFHTGTFKMPTPASAPEISVVVEGNSDSGTAWDLYIDLYTGSSSNGVETFHFSGHGETVSAIDHTGPIALASSSFPSNGSIANAGDSAVYSLDIAAGKTYLVTVESSASRLDPSLHVEDSTGNPIGTFTSNVSGNGAFAFVTSTTQDTAQLTVEGESSTTGAFQINAADATGNVKSLIYVSSNVDAIEENPAVTDDDDATSGGALNIYRDGDISGTSTVQWRIVPKAGTGASLADLDGISASGTVTFLAGEYVKSLSFMAVADGIAEQAEHFTFEITGASSAIFLNGRQGEFGGSVGFDVVDTRELPMTKVGEAGPDIILGGSLADTLSGNFGDDEIYGGAGDDILDGGPGVDLLVGATGNDLFFADDLDDIVEHLGEGSDRVVASANFTLATGTDIERLTTTNTASTAPINLTGNEIRQFIQGNAGANILDGKGGVDYLQGFGGNDLYYVDNGSDVVIEAAGGGSDRVLASVSYVVTSGVDVERLTTAFTGGTAAINLTGNGSVQLIQGNQGANILDGKGGADTLQGFGGNDFYYVDNAGDRVIEVAGGGTDAVYASVSYALGAAANVEVLNTSFAGGTAAINLTGNGLAQTVNGNAGSNILDGKGGVDTMKGFGGNDFYYVDNGSDHVVEAAGGGTDAVYASVSYALAAAANVEVLNTSFAGGTAAINLTGNALAQTVNGNQGANIIDGKGGADIMKGFGGNDIYYVDNAGDQVIEAAGGGTDAVYASLNYTLGAAARVEELNTSYSAATTAINLRGNDFSQTVRGNAGRNNLQGAGGDDTMIGGIGRDVLNGGAGNDIFDFNAISEMGITTNTRDVIVDFTRGQDRIDLSTIDGTGYGPGEAFNFIGVAGFNHVAGELRYVQHDDANDALDITYVAGDVNSDGLADFQIALTGLINLAATDFVL